MKESVDIQWMFTDLLKFRQNIYNLTNLGVVMMEGFCVGAVYSQYLQSELKNLIKENIEEIDNTLWLILDPKQKEIDLEELKNKFDYPDVDLDKIDLDWRV